MEHYTELKLTIMYPTGKDESIVRVEKWDLSLEDSTREDMYELFERLLKAAGFSIPTDQ